jgi:hypothetical protein
MHFAVKKLTRSDLTFFEHQFRRQNAGNQKGINLSAKVFVDQIFPYVRTVATGEPRYFPIKLQIYGPGLRKVPDLKTRSITAKSRWQKNWRLNGEFIPDPVDDPTRYHGLEAGDLVVFAFEDSRTTGVPEAITLVLLSNAEPNDKRVIADLQLFLGVSEMLLLSVAELATVSSASAPEHPIREILDIEQDTALDEAAQGSTEAIRKLLAKPSPRRMTPAALRAARTRMEANDRRGELLVNFMLQRDLYADLIRDFEWVSDSSALSPWHFKLIDRHGAQVRVLVKSSSGAFDRSIHITQNEVLCAAEVSAARTDLYWVYDIGTDDATLQITEGIAELCRHISSSAASLGPGLSPDRYSVDAKSFRVWAAPVRLTDNDPDNDGL